MLGGGCSRLLRRLHGASSSLRALRQPVRVLSSSQSDGSIKGAPGKTRPVHRPPPTAAELEMLRQNPFSLEAEEADEEAEDLPPAADYVNKETGEVNGPRGPEPTRFGDWEKNGRCSDF